jgi:hypothetical protein
MIRSLSERLELDADPNAVIARFRGDPGTWLPEPATPVPEHHAHWMAYLRTPAGVGMLVDTTVGAPYNEHGMVWRLLRWDPHAPEEETTVTAKVAPTFEGDVGIRPGERDGIILEVRGEYAPPAGLVGTVADALGLHRVAAGTARQFLADIGARLLVTGETSGQGHDAAASARRETSSFDKIVET